MEPQLQTLPTCLCTNLRRTARAISNIYDTALAPCGIKITQFSLLRAVERREPVAISDLADDVVLDRTTLARNLAPLERDGLLILSTGADQRVTEVRLTRKGRDRIEKALPLWTATQAEVSRLLSPGRIAQIRDIAREATHAATAFAGSPIRKKRATR
jgi:DNA-binding MarR family transcriptional regulator